MHGGLRTVPLVATGPTRKNTCINFELDLGRPNGGADFLQDHVPPSGWFHCG